MKAKHKLIIALSVSLMTLTIELMRIPIFDTLDSFFNELKFKFRGQQHVDTSLVFLYIDDNAIHSLGGYPLKRTYYALLIDLLTQLNVRAIMLDILLTDKNPDYPERDNLLVLIVKNSNRVYLGGSFTNLERSNHNEIHFPESLKKFLIKPNVQISNFHKGTNFRLPFDELLKSCAGLGHLNYIQNDSRYEIPLLVQVAQDLYLPSISLELARTYYGIPRDSIKVFESSIILGDVKIPLKNGTMLINYTGGTDALKMYSILDFIKSYDAIKSGIEPEIDLDNFKDKIVFIGIYSEALGQTIKTPFQDKFPTTGLHIMALNTIVQKKFLTETTLILNFAISLLFSLLILHLLSLEHISTVFRILLFQSAVISALLLVLLFLFKLGISVPIYPIFAGLFSLFAGIIYNFEIERQKMIKFNEEKRKIEDMIKEKELKIIDLQEQIENLKIAAERNEAIKNLEKTYSEVKELTSKFEDLSEFNLTDETEKDEFEGIVFSKGGKMEEIISIMKKVAPSDVPVLITGENGVGKELVAMAIHKLSERKDKKFITINCSAIPETLLESELFGHEKGAFTGAVQRKKGLFEIADGGTIFLDEIAETTESFQAKILRIIQSGEFNRIGGVETLKVNVRIIAATNRDIEKALREGNFREDLYYRLNVVRIHIPPLRERKEDIRFLAEHFLKKFKANDMKFSSAVMIAFLNYEWPGNVRQLENAVKRAIIFAKSEGRKLIQLKDLPEEIAKSAKGKIDIEEEILTLLREKKFSHSSISETANELGLNRGTVGEYLRGLCFKNLYESKFDINKASLKITGNDPEALERLKKKIADYIHNFIENIANCKSEEEIRSIIRLKYKNLPARYHFYLEEFAMRFKKGEITTEKLGINDGNF